jgi:hypothetical protein
MNRASTLLDDALSMLAQHGYRPTVSNGGKHTKVKWVDQAGHVRMLVISRSPSTRMVRFAQRRILRRLLRGNGG